MSRGETMSPETVGKFHTRLLPITLPFVLYGIFRYLYLLYRRELGGNPSDLLLSDRALLANTVLWMVTLVVIIYAPVWNPAWPETGVSTQATISTGAAESGWRGPLAEGGLSR